MADGALTLTLDEPTAERLAAAARAAGVTPEVFAAQRLSLDLGPAHDWTEADRRLAEYDRTGEFVTFENWSTDFKADVRRRLDGKT